DHPELGEVAARVRVLRAEGRPEGVDARERERRDLGLELPRDGEEGLAREEVAREVDAAVLAERRARGVERGGAGERAGALGVRGGDDRRVQQLEAARVEEVVDRARRGAAHALDRAERVRAQAQVPELAQELEGVALLLERVVLARGAEHGDALRGELEGLAAARRGTEQALRLDRVAGADAPQLGLGVREAPLGRRLEARPARAARELEEGDALGVARGAHPALRDGGPPGRRAGEELADRRVHRLTRGRGCPWRSSSA